MRQIRPLLIAPVLFALAACNPADPAAERDATADPAFDQGSGSDIEPRDPAPMDAAPADAFHAQAGAVLEPTQGNETGGNLRFELVDGSIHITGEVTGLSAGGEHGFHVHETGDCSAPDATSAGGHFNPDDSDHGRAGQGEHHVGDSDNLIANDDGVAEVDRWLHGATLGDGADTDIVGKGVIVHADADDYVSQPTGDAGDRLACGVIELR